MEFKKKVAYNLLISVLAKVVTLIIGLVTIGLITRYLGQSGFGEFSTILAFLFVFSVLADLGLYSITLKEISKDGTDEKKIIGNVFSFRLISGFLIFSAAALIGFIFPYSWSIKIGILIASLGYWSMSSSQILIGAFQKYLRMEKVALADGFSRLIQLGLILFFIQKNSGFFSIVWAFSIASLINLFLLLVFIQKHIPFKLEFDFVFLKKTLIQSYPLALGAVLTMFYFKMDTVLLSLMKPSSDVGIYSLPYRILEVLIFFPSMFTGLIMPFLSKYVFTEPEKLKNIIQKSWDLLLITIIPLTTGILFLSKRVILLLGSSEFIKSVDVLNILIFATAIIFMSNLLYNIIVVLEKQKQFIWIFGVGAVLNIVSNLIFIPKYSYYATSINTVITEFLVAGLMLLVIYRTLNYFPSSKLFFKSFFASLAMAAALYFLSGWPLLALLTISILIYFIFLYLLRGVSKEDILIFFPGN